VIAVGITMSRVVVSIGAPQAKLSNKVAGWRQVVMSQLPGNRFVHTPTFAGAATGVA
jgi:hypothetical protein